MLSIDPAARTPLTRQMTSESSHIETPAASELSLSDALTFAVRIHRAGDVDNAETLYRRILEAVPEQPDALNFLGMIAMHRGRIDDAIALIRKSIAVEPHHADRYTNLGNVLVAAERIDEAVAAYERAIELSPAQAAAYNNLGIIYRAQRRYDDAALAYDRALELDPQHVEAWNNSGNLHAARGDNQRALKHYSKALTLRPGDRKARHFIALAYAAIDDLPSAAQVYREWLQEEPDDPGLKHMLAACSGVGVPERAADDYIERTFDSFSESFDSKLAHLEYRAPELVAAAVEEAGIAPAKRLQVLDAGCGTGLCGPLLAPYSAALRGVDLSQGMLNKARLRGVYDDLVKAELTQYLESCREAYDLIVSADTLVYFGALADVLGGASGALRPAGSLIFTVERAEEAAAPEGHRINPHGRYSHTKGYVERVLRTAGFAAIHIRDDVLRHEGGAPVNGLVVTARKARPNAPEPSHAS